jgi:hypothetical protein
MRAYLITIVMPDGSRGMHNGLYEDGFEAVLRAIDLFPAAKRIAARRLA